MRGARFILTRVHRWTGLALAAFLIVVAATGAMLPFQVELQRLVAPDRFVSPPFPGAQPLDWLALRQIAERKSGGVITRAPLRIFDEAATAYSVSSRAGAADLGFDEILVDPYTGREIARDRSGDLRDGTAQIVPFLFTLHQNLTLGDWGAWLLGIVALAWTVDCFVGLYLTFPTSRAHWWRHWGRSWIVKTPIRSRFRLHFDLHRVSGLWIWPMLFVFAWSGVAFNLPQVYLPVMTAFVGYAPPRETSVRAEPAGPRLSWAQGLAAARKRAIDVTTQRGVTIEWEREMRYNRASNSYALALRTNRDRSDAFANSWINIDADDGHLLSVEFPTGEHFGNTLDYWLGLLHEAGVFGVGFRIFVSACGIVIVVLTITGVLIWLIKRSSRMVAKAQGNVC